MNIISSSKAVTAANTAKDGTGTANFIIRAPKDRDLWIERVEYKQNGATTNTTVARHFVTTGDNEDPANNSPIGPELDLPAVTVDETAAKAEIKLDLRFWLPAGHRLYFLLGTSVTAGWIATAVAGRYQDLQSQPVS